MLGERQTKLLMSRVRAAHAYRVVATKLRVIVHNFAPQLFDQLLSDRRLCDSDDHFIRFTGIDFV
jgi:hypothetical protein